MNTTSAPTSVDFANVTDALQIAVAEGQTTGVSLIITNTGGQTLYKRAFGDFTTNTITTIASTSKMPSVVAILTLVYQGKLSLDDPVARYLNYWPTDKSGITLRQLLSHTSGLPSYTPCVFDPSTTLDACSQIIASAPLQARPGSQFSYSGSDYQVAGRIAEVVSGKPWAQFFQDAVAKPCGLSAFTYGKTLNPRIGGSASTNLHDYAALLAMNLNGGFCGATRILSGQLVAEMRKDEIGDVPILSSPYSDGRHYGLGWWLDPATDTHGSEFSDAGSFGSTAWIDLHRGYGALLLMQTNWATGQAVWNNIKPLINADFAADQGQFRLHTPEHIRLLTLVDALRWLASMQQSDQRRRIEHVCRGAVGNNVPCSLVRKGERLQQNRSG